MDGRYLVWTAVRVFFGLVLLRRDSDNPVYELIYILLGLFVLWCAIADAKEREFANRKDKYHAPYF